MKILICNHFKVYTAYFPFACFLASCKKVPPEVKTIHELPKGIVSITFVKYDSLLIDSEHVVVNYSGDSVNVLVPPGTSLHILHLLSNTRDNLFYLQAVFRRIFHRYPVHRYSQ